MKRVLKIILPIVLTLALLVGIGWYLFQYDRDFTRDMLLSWARSLDDAGNHTMANWFYGLAYQQAGNDAEIAIELANQYKKLGNYTKAENTLANAIADGGSIELYIALCQTYVEQDKLVDAVNMLDTITNQEIKTQLDELRPQAPTLNYAPGNYNEYISLAFQSTDGKVYASFENKYPSVKKNLVTAPYTLGDGATTIQAVCVSDNGLVSPLVIYSYTVSRVHKYITLSDPAIDRTVREFLGVDEDYQLSTTELLDIEVFMIPTDAQSIEDLYYMPLLKTLVIRDCKLPDLQPLSQLKELEDLVIANLVLSPSDVQTIASLATLKALTADNCSLSDIRAFESLTSMEYLDLRNNAITDLSILSAMPNLTYLDLSHNALTSLAGMEALTLLEQIDLSYNSIASLEPLSACTQILTLDVSNNQLTNLSGLENADRMGMLYAAFNNLTNISPLETCISLTDLNISHNKIKNISALAKLPKLHVLNFAYNQVTALPAFAEDSILMQIDGSHNQITSLEPLSGLTLLSQVNMSYNAKIKSIVCLLECPNITYIDVLETAVTDISAFKGMEITILYNLT